MLKVDGINQSGSVILSVRLSDQGSSAPWTDDPDDTPLPVRTLQRSDTHKSLARHNVDIPTARSLPEVSLASPSPQSAEGTKSGIAPVTMPLLPFPFGCIIAVSDLGVQMSLQKVLGDAELRLTVTWVAVENLYASRLCRAVSVIGKSALLQ